MIDNFLDELKTNGTADNTIKSYLSILKVANEFKELPDWSKNDITKYILHLQTKNKPSSIEIRKAILKKFFTWAEKKEIVEHLKVKLPKNNLRREDILTIEDIDKLIASTDSHLYKALIAFLFESGARISEATAVTIKDTEETDKGILISVPQTKNGKDTRKNIYIFCQQYIRNHITYSGLSKNDKLFPLSEVAIGKMLKKIAKKASIEKPVTPHKFRHAQATDMVLRKYQESVIRKKLGWTGDSKMIARYQHIIDEDVINATLEINGSEIQNTPLKNLKKGEPLKITEISLQLKKLNDENEEMKKELKKSKEDSALQLKKLSDEITQLSAFFGATKLILEGSKNTEITTNELIGLIPTDSIDPKISMAIERATKKSMLNFLQDYTPMTEAEQQEELKKLKEKGIDVNPNHTISLTFEKEDFEKAPELLKQIEEHKKGHEKAKDKAPRIQAKTK